MSTRRTVTFEVVGIPAPKGSTKAFMPKGARFPIVTHDNPRTRWWQHLVSDQAQKVATGDLFVGPVMLWAKFYLPRPISLPRKVAGHTKKPDLSKLVRCIEDALTGILLRDDAQIVEIHTAKYYAAPDKPARAVITVEDFTPRDLAPGELFTEDVHAPTA